MVLGRHNARRRQRNDDRFTGRDFSREKRLIERRRIHFDSEKRRHQQTHQDLSQKWQIRLLRTLRFSFGHRPRWLLSQLFSRSLQFDSRHQAALSGLAISAGDSPGILTNFLHQLPFVDSWFNTRVRSRFRVYRTTRLRVRPTRPTFSKNMSNSTRKWPTSWDSGKNVPKFMAEPRTRFNWSVRLSKLFPKLLKCLRTKWNSKRSIRKRPNPTRYRRESALSAAAAAAQRSIPRINSTVCLCRLTDNAELLKNRLKSLEDSKEQLDDSLRQQIAYNRTLEREMHKQKPELMQLVQQREKHLQYVLVI